jgi:hypothetical protein
MADLSLRDTDLLAPHPSTLLRQIITAECEAMALYALGAGVHIPVHLLPLLEASQNCLATASGTPPDLTELARMHATLSDLVAPATPRAILLLHEEKTRHPIISSFGAVPIVRRLLLAALISMAVMLLSALSPAINPDTMKYDLVEGHGVTLFFCELFLVSASCLGSSFAALFRISKYVSKGTYDPHYRSTYWIQVVLGIVSGMLLSQIIFHSLRLSNSSSFLLDQPVLALVGGFSSTLVYRILTRFMDAVESVFGKEPETTATLSDLRTRRVRQAVTSRQQIAAQEATAAEALPETRDASATEDTTVPLTLPAQPFPAATQ